MVHLTYQRIHVLTSSQSPVGEVGYSNTNRLKTYPSIGVFPQWWYPKMDGLYGKPHFLMDDLGVPAIWGNTHINHITLSGFPPFPSHRQDETWSTYLDSIPKLSDTKSMSSVFLHLIIASFNEEAVGKTWVFQRKMWDHIQKMEVFAEIWWIPIMWIVFQLHYVNDKRHCLITRMEAGTQLQKSNNVSLNRACAASPPSTSQKAGGLPSFQATKDHV